MGILDRLFGRVQKWDDEPLQSQRAYVQEHLDQVRQRISAALGQMGDAGLTLPALASSIPELQPECDALPLASGPFGTTDTNPIPVNGPQGEVVYINRLRSPSGCGFFFHRLGSLKSKVYLHPIDDFELLAIDGSANFHLFFAMYHPRRSQLLPAGCTRVPWNRMADLERLMCKIAAFGTTSIVPDFPWGLPAAIRQSAELTAISPGLDDSLARRVENLLQRLPQRGHR